MGSTVSSAADIPTKVISRDTFDNALLLAATVKAALANGVRHFDQKGRLLIDPADVLKALLIDGGVVLDDSDAVQRVTVDEVLAELEAQYRSTA